MSQNKVVTDQDFYFQTAESASCGLVDSRKPGCYEPPEEDTGSVFNQTFVHIFDAKAMCQGKDFHLFDAFVANRPAGLSGQQRCSPRERRGQNAHTRQLENCHGIWINLYYRIKTQQRRVHM